MNGSNRKNETEERISELKIEIEITYPVGGKNKNKKQEKKYIKRN